MTTTIRSVLEIIGNTSLRNAWCWPRGLGVQSPRPSQSSGLEVCGTRMAMVGRWIKVTIKNNGWAVTHSWVMEQKVEPITTGLPLKCTIECISYEYLQSVCKIKYFITCTKVVYIGAGVFVKMHQFWILSFPPQLLTATGWCFVCWSTVWTSVLWTFCKGKVSIPSGVCVCLFKQTE